MPDRYALVIYMKLIVGLGNPDPEYAGTRHNVGWQFLDWLNEKYKGGTFSDENKILSRVAKIKIGPRQGSRTGIVAWLIKPQTYVNKSGQAVAKAKTWAKAKNDDTVIVHDDLDIPFGMCKLSFDKNSGGHKGVESVTSYLKTKKFYRIRIGTGVRALDNARGQSDKKRDEFVRDFVLKEFTPSERKELSGIFAACETRLIQILR